MGILNTTPDSFSDGGNYVNLQQAIDRIGQMIDEGARIIDIGGESTRPGSDPVTEDEELERVIPVFQKAIKSFDSTIFSVDTTKYVVAKEALKAGCHIVNDVSGLEKEPRFAELCSEFNAGYVLMHSKGDPKTMQKNPVYENVVEEIKQFFKTKTDHLIRSGVKSVMIDPGIGFGKTLKHNLSIISGLGSYLTLGFPILTGASRKSMIGQLLGNRDVDGRLAGTIAVHYQCLINGAKILRVHDVQEATDSIEIFNALHEPG
ncbi:MAG: dihydropteroate synthase [Balneolaceae bacterium]|nr:dihydropteroate synthase [Balneolaceae bacterium]